MFNAGFAGGKGGSADPKSALNQMMQKIAQRPLTKADIVFTVNQFDSQYQAIVKLHCLEGKEYAGHLCTNSKEAEKSAAEQAMIANAALLTQMQNMPKAKRPRDSSAQPAAKKAKVPAPNLPFKTEMNNILTRIIGRTPAKGDATYIVNTIAPGQFQATLQISCLPEEWSGKAWAGELKPSKAEAEQSAAEQALTDIKSIAPGEKVKKKSDPSDPSAPKQNKPKKPKPSKQETAMEQMMELMNAWTEQVSKQEDQDFSTKMMLWMMNGARGKPPREIVAEKPVTGSVVAWKGTWGYLKPDTPLNHEAEKQKEGKIWVGKKDLAAGVTELMEGMKVTFKVYCDTEGLGATECSIV